MSCYPAMFAALRERGEGIFVPFIVVGGPDPDTSEAVIEVPTVGGVDVFGPGVPFTDPVIDGPTIQKARVRILVASVGFQDYLEVIRRVHRRHPWLPIGMLIYGNVPFAMGLEHFYSEYMQAGINSVLLPDVPIRESVVFNRTIEKADVNAVYIASSSAAVETLDAVAATSHGYVCAVSRVGMTGTERAFSTVGLAESVEHLHANAAAPVMPGSGISTPEQVTEAIAAGTDGAISGSITIKIVECCAPETMTAASSNNSTGGDEEHRHHALGALRSDLVTFTATTEGAMRPH